MPRTKSPSPDLDGDVVGHGIDLNPVINAPAYREDIFMKEWGARVAVAAACTVVAAALLSTKGQPSIKTKNELAVLFLIECPGLGHRCRESPQAIFPKIEDCIKAIHRLKNNMSEPQRMIWGYHCGSQPKISRNAMRNSAPSQPSNG